MDASTLAVPAKAPIGAKMTYQAAGALEYGWEHTGEFSKVDPDRFGKVGIKYETVIASPRLICSAPSCIGVKRRTAMARRVHIGRPASLEKTSAND
jgi:hypothetical protein